MIFHSIFHFPFSLDEWRNVFVVHAVAGCSGRAGKAMDAAADVYFKFDTCQHSVYCQWQRKNKIKISKKTYGAARHNAAGKMRKKKLYLHWKKEKNRVYGVTQSAATAIATWRLMRETAVHVGY